MRAAAGARRAAARRPPSASAGASSGGTSSPLSPSTSISGIPPDRRGDDRSRQRHALEERERERVAQRRDARARRARARPGTDSPRKPVTTTHRVQPERGDPLAHAPPRSRVGKRADEHDAARRGTAARIAGAASTSSAGVLAPVEVPHHADQRRLVRAEDRRRRRIRLARRCAPRPSRCRPRGRASRVGSRRPRAAPARASRPTGAMTWRARPSQCLRYGARAAVARVDVHHLRNAREPARQVAQRESRQRGRVEHVGSAREPGEAQDVGRQHERARQPPPASQARQDGGARGRDADRRRAADAAPGKA